MMYLLLIVVFAAVAAILALNRPQLVVIDAEVPADYPAEGFSHSRFENLLHTYVDEHGHVDYERWHRNDADLHTLDVYLAAVAAYSPDNSPERFSHQSDQLAYWLYAYNAYVVKNVLNNWPLPSVRQLRAPVELAKGFGFFWRQRFLFGGEAYSLHAVENDIIRKTYLDPRIHFVLNCASESCPAMRPDLPTGDDLEPFLASATIDFLGDPDNVTVDHASRRIVLSHIFKWYEEDFVNDVRRRGLSTDRGVVDYLVSAAPESVAMELIGAKGYAVEFADYDWSINDAEAGL